MSGGKFAYVQDHRSKHPEFLILRKIAGSQFGYVIMARTHNEDIAKAVVTALLQEHGLQQVTGERYAEIEIRIP